MRKLLFALALSFAPLISWADATFVGSPTVLNSGGTCTPGAGSNRLLVITHAAEPTANDTTPTVTALSVGSASLANGQVIQAVAASRNNAGSQHVTAYVWYVKEANIGSGAQTVSVTWSETMSGGTVLTCYTVQDADQIVPIDTTQVNNSTSGDPWTNTLTVASGSVQVLSAGINVNNSSTPDASWTEDADNADGASRVVSQHKTTTTGGSITWQLDFAASNNGAVAVASFAKFPANCGANGSSACQEITLGSIGTGSPCAAFNVVNDPDLVAGDSIKAATATANGAVLTIGSDCQFSYPNDTARQLALNNPVYDVSAGAYHASDIDFVANDPGIQCSEDFSTVYKVGQAISTLDFNQFCQHPLGDTLSFALTSGSWPTGLSLNGGTGALTGTPTVENESGVNLVVTATSTVTGVTATQNLKLYPIDTLTMPDCQTSHLEMGACITALQAIFLDAGVISFSYSTSVAAGNVISQSVTPGTQVEAFSTTNLEVSRGVASGVQPWPTIFLNDLTAVPSNAVFRVGEAFTQTGDQYVALWPASNRVVYQRGLAYRQDGAQTICVSGCTISTYIRGIAVTSRGEIVAEECIPVLTVAGKALKMDGTLCVSNAD